MLHIGDLEKRFEVCYANKVTQYTQNKRRMNISIINKIIDADIKSNNLTYNKKEFRLKIYETKNGESVHIQYPGMISARKKNAYSWDFKPIIVNQNGQVCDNATFQKMWDIFEEVINKHRDLLKTLSLLFFRMGRMIEYQLIDVDTPICLVENQEKVIALGERHKFKLYKLVFRDDEIEALNYNAKKVMFQEGFEVSFEAFIYFFDMILQIEDCKYFIKNEGKLKSGRIPSSDSMLLLSAYFNKYIPISKMLQKFIDGKGTAKCTNSEYKLILGREIKFINPVEYIKKAFDENGVAYCEGSTVLYDKILKCKFYIDSVGVFIFEEKPADDICHMIHQAHKTYISLDRELEKNMIDKILEKIKNNQRSIKEPES